MTANAYAAFSALVAEADAYAQRGERWPGLDPNAPDRAQP